MDNTVMILILLAISLFTISRSIAELLIQSCPKDKRTKLATFVIVTLLYILIILLGAIFSHKMLEL